MSLDRPNISNVDDRQRVRRDTDWVSEAADISIITPLIPNLQFDPPTQMRKVNRKRNLGELIPVLWSSTKGWSVVLE